MSPGVKRRRNSLHQYGEVLLLSNVCPLKGLQDFNEQLSPGPSTCCLHMLLSISLLQIKCGCVFMLYVCICKIFRIPYNVLRMSPGVKRRRFSLHHSGEVLLLNNVCP